MRTINERNERMSTEKDEILEASEENNEQPEKKEKKSSKKEKENKKIEELENALKESEDKYLRMFAEYDNFKKRTAKEKEFLYKEGIADSVANLLTVLDNLDRAAAVDVSKSDAQSVVDGVNKILEQAKEVFAKMGVEEIPAKGEKFNPDFHNAVMHEDNEEYDENTISDVFLKGYKMGDKVIRHSMVKVMN